MRIELDDPVHADALVRFLRERACIAYVVDAPNMIEVIRARSVGEQEAYEIRSRLDSWRGSGEPVRRVVVAQAAAAAATARDDDLTTTKLTYLIEPGVSGRSAVGGCKLLHPRTEWKRGFRHPFPV